MTLSTGPWWCAPVLASGSMITVPAHSFSAPVRAVVTAAARVMPGVCGVLMSSSSLRTTRTPLVRQSVATLGVFHGLDQGVAEETGFRRQAPALCYRPSAGARRRGGGRVLCSARGRRAHDASWRRGAGIGCGVGTAERLALARDSGRRLRVDRDHWQGCVDAVSPSVRSRKSRRRSGQRRSSVGDGHPGVAWARARTRHRPEPRSDGAVGGALDVAVELWRRGVSNIRWVSTITTSSRTGSTSHDVPKPPSQPYAPDLFRA